MPHAAENTNNGMSQMNPTTTSILNGSLELAVVVIEDRLLPLSFLERSLSLAA
jgi:hypothetical protein